MNIAFPITEWWQRPLPSLVTTDQAPGLWLRSMYTLTIRRFGLEFPGEEEKSKAARVDGNRLSTPLVIEQTEHAFAAYDCDSRLLIAAEARASSAGRHFWKLQLESASSQLPDSAIYAIP